MNLPGEPFISTFEFAVDQDELDIHREKLCCVTRNGQWDLEAKRLIEIVTFSQEFIEAFHATWTVQGHHIRSQVGDDIHLVRLLKHILPKCEGSDKTLYRGENLERWREKSVGLAWTSSIEVARMFGSGLNATGTGGVLLRCKFVAHCIIAAPSAHSNYLQEYEFTVDPFEMKGVDVLEEYPSSD